MIAALRRRIRRRRSRTPDGASGTAFRLYSARDLRIIRSMRRFYEIASLPFVTYFLLLNRRFDHSYGLTWRKRWRLTLTMYRNTRHIETGTSWRAHVAMASKIFEIPATVPGVIVEAGCWKGGSTANLSLVAEATGRQLVVYDSFEGMPPPAEGDRWASALGEGSFLGALEEVRANVTRYGAVEVCQFRKGWFSDSLAAHREPIVAAFVDVDYQDSMHSCVLGLWPHLVDSGYWFIDEYTRLDYCALFFSERYWRTYFDRPPPGLMGAGTGVGVGAYFTGPLRGNPPAQSAQSIGWTRKDFYGEWDYFPDDAPPEPLSGGPGAVTGTEGWFTTANSMEEHGERLLAQILAQRGEQADAGDVTDDRDARSDDTR